MGKFMKPGKVVMVLAGRYAGRKAVIVKVSLKIVAFLLFHFLLALGCEFVVHMMPDQQYSSIKPRTEQTTNTC